MVSGSVPFGGAEGSRLWRRRGDRRGVPSRPPRQGLLPPALSDGGAEPAGAGPTSRQIPPAGGRPTRSQAPSRAQEAVLLLRRNAGGKATGGPAGFKSG